MTIKGGVRKDTDASWGIDDVEFADEVVKFMHQVAWPYDDVLASRKADCSNSPTKRCE